MLFFSTAEQRAFSGDFDFLMGSAYEALRDPVIAKALGDCAIGLAEILDSVFPPNIRKGRLSLPFARRNDVCPTVIPLNEEQAENVDRFITPVCNKVTTSWPTNNRYSSFYDIDVWDEVDRLLHMQMDSPRDIGATSRWIAKTVIGVELIDNSTVKGTRPVIAVRMKHHAFSSLAAAGTMLHEGVHVDDLQRDGPLLYGTVTYGAATEARAHYVNSLVYPSNWIRRAEEARLASVDPARPFTPTQDLIAFYQSEGVLS